MKTRVVKQYCCEFCRKRGLSASHMAKHERRCTLNPRRVCNVCRMQHGLWDVTEQVRIEDMLACLPKHDRAYYEKHSFDVSAEGDAVRLEIKQAVARLRELTKCPACILAALRQANIPVPMADGFDFTTEMKAIWDDINDSNALSAARACRYG